MDKVCTKCYIPQPETNFKKRKAGKNGLDAWCKCCWSIYAKEYRSKNIEKRREYERNWSKKQYETNPLYSQRIIDKNERYRLRNLDKVNTRARNRYKNNELIRFCVSIRVLMRKAFNDLALTKKYSTFEYLQYSQQDLVDHLSAWLDKPCELCKNITLSRVSSNFAIDHIVPLGSAQNESEIIDLNKLTNLRLLYFSCNSIKGIEDKKLIELKREKNSKW